MSKNCIIWLILFICLTTLLIVPSSRQTILAVTKLHPYIMGFMKFAIFGFLGELLGGRILNGKWEKIKGTGLRIVAWGFFGVIIAFVLPLSFSGARILLDQFVLPFEKNVFLNHLVQAFLASMVLNMLPGPMAIIYHKIAETYIELGHGRFGKMIKIRFSHAIRKIDWENQMGFVILKICLIIFIPLHTITFMLPSNYRVLLAAYSTILLGAVLGYSKQKIGNLKKILA